jgi:hypothetical protein
MEAVSTIVTLVLNALLLPFGAAHRTLGLIWLSLLTGVGMAFVFKLTSNREKIKASKDRFKSFILEMRIYKDDLGIVLAAFLKALRANLGYMRQILVPFLVLVAPAVIVFLQLDERYGRSEIPAGSTTVLSVFLTEGADPFVIPVSVACSPGVSMDAGPVRIREKREIDWRLRIDSPGMHTVTLSTDGHEYALPLVAEPAHRMIGSSRGVSSIIEPFVHPALPPIPDDSPIKSVRLHYPGASYPLLLWRVHWIVVFLVFSLIGAVATKVLVGFEI